MGSAARVAALASRGPWCERAHVPLTHSRLCLGPGVPDPRLSARAPGIVARRYVEKRLLEQKVQALSGQIDERDRLETSIEARIFSLFGRLQQLEDTNLKLEVQAGRLDDAPSMGM